MSDSVREAAFIAAKRILGGAYSNLVFTASGLTDVDRAFAERIALGVAERKLTLRFVLDTLVSRPMNEGLDVLLMTGLYQIFYMSRVPDSAACNETTELTKKLYGERIAGFANGVLRNAVRKKSALLALIDSAEPFIRYSADERIYKLIQNEYPDECEGIFKAFLETPPCFLRVNTLKTNASTVAHETGGTVVGDSSVEAGNASDAVARIGCGHFFIQGLASQTAVRELCAESGDTVIDVCACPGGKSLGAAIDMKNEGRIISLDLHGNKLPLIEKSAKLLGINIIETDIHDAKNAKPEFTGIADKVICDVPCSGLGEIGSKPEIKYKNPDDFNGLYPIQARILSESAKYLKVGGTMVYSTCSIDKRENSDNIKSFLASECGRGFTLLTEKTVLPTGKEREGFYFAKLKRET